MILIKNIYSDIPMFIEPNPFDKDMVIKKDQNAINESVRNILLTRNGERPFESNFGTNLLNAVFENPTILELYCDAEVVHSLNAHESRATVSTRKYDFNTERNALISVEYFISDLSIQQKTSITLERT